MKTSAISNPANIISGSATATKPAGLPADQSFGQVLSREMAARPKASEPSKAASAEPTKGPQAPKANAAEAKSENAKPAEKQDTSATQDSGARPVATDKSVKAEKTQAKSDDEDQDDDTTVSDASAELLALVANLTQPAAAPADASAGDANASADDESTDQDDKVTLDASDSKGQEQLLASLVAATPAGKPEIAAETAQATEVASLDAKTPRRALGIGKDEAARAIIAQRLNGRAESATVKTEPKGEAKEFNTELKQSATDKAAPETGAAKNPAAQTETSSLQHAFGQAVAHAAQDAQQTSAAPINIAAMPPIQAQPVQLAPEAARQMTDMLAPRVGSQGWDQALGQKVVWMVGGELQSASLTLNPPDLGPLQIVLHVSENQATANFTAAQPEVRHALEAAMPKLREMLGDAGIQLSQANVNAGTPNNQQGAFEQPQSSRRNTAGGGQSDSSDTPIRTTRTQAISGGQGLVDTFA